jgi:T5SS/PEP-CTERM-associated repeat protein
MRWSTLATLLLTVFFANAVRGDITWTGDLDPADPNTWTSGTDGTIGKAADGELAITSGGAVSDSRGYIGLVSGSTGQVTVDGTGSTWTSDHNLHIGSNGNGTLKIAGAASVSSDNGLVGYGFGS